MIPFKQGLLTISFLLCAFALLAQGKAPKMKYGKVSEEEMSMTTFEADPSAPAVVLFDKGTVVHRYDNTTGFILEYEHHKRIKIFKKDGYSFADLAVFFYKGQKLTEFKACCYNLEGGKVVETKMNSDNIFEEKLTSSVFVKKGAIPGVREGSVIEFKYTVLDEGIGLPVSEWVFQDAIAPTLWSEFEASVPTFIEYKKLAQGWTPYALAKEELKNERLNIHYVNRNNDGNATISSSENINIDYTTNILHYIQENVPALKPEPFVASVRDYLSQISFDVSIVYQTSVVPNGPTYKLVNGSYKERSNTWEQLGKDLWEDTYHDVLSSSKFTGSETAKCIEGTTGSAEKTAAIYAYIGKNYQNTGYDYFWKSQTLDDLTRNKKGTPTDLNLLFINMLKRAELTAFPVLISSRDHGKALSFRVSVREFDRVITAIQQEDGSFALVDASGWPNPIGLLPIDASHGEGLLLQADKGIQWIPLQSKIADRAALLSELTIKPDGMISGKVSFSETGHAAVTGRETIRLKDAQTFVKEHFKDMVSNGQLTELSTEETGDWNTPGLKGTFMLETPAFVTVSGDKIYLDPLLHMGLKETPFKNPDRKFGVDFGPPSVSTHVFSFAIPPGYRVEEAPKSLKLVLDEQALSFDYLVDKSNPELIKITVKRSTKSPFLPVEKFPDLQQFYATMVAKMAEPIVLTK